MITIKEDTPKKLSGRTSLFLSPPITKEIEEIVKCIVPIHINKITHEVEIPLTSLSFLLDNLTYIDDINLILKQEEQHLNTLKPILSYKTKPFQHQLDAITFGLNRDKWLLLDAPGLGKTLSIIYLAEELRAQKGLKHCLIVCGVASLRSNWKKEIVMHSNLTCRILGETISKKGNVNYTSLDERVKELESGIDDFFIITNIESFRDKKIQKLITRGPNKGQYKSIIVCPLLEAIKKSNIDMVVIDEAHAIKDDGSQQSKNFSRVPATYKVAATGTLLLNSPLDARIALNWTENDPSANYNFESQYCVYGGFSGNQIVGYKNLNLLKEEIEMCSLRRTKDLLDLPPKTVINEYVDVNKDHFAFYNDVVNGVKEECDKVELNTRNLLALTTRLRQASSLPTVLTSKEIIPSKIVRCVELIKELVEQKEKVVVMSTFKESVDYLSKLIPEYKPLICTGESSDIEKNKELFQNDDEHYVMLCTWQKMGTGHTLNRASYMIFIDTPWTFGVFDQACDRIHRIGSKNPVFIYNLIATNTIDEKVLELLNKKKALSNFVIDDKLDEDDEEVLKIYIKDL